MAEDVMTVGGLSSRTGMSSRLIRRLTDEGLIYSRGRTAAGYRLYDQSALWCVEVITRLRAIGLTIDEIQRLGDAYLHQPNVDVRRLFEQTLEDAQRRVLSRIGELEAVKTRQEDILAGHRDGNLIQILPPDPTRG